MPDDLSSLKAQLAKQNRQMEMIAQLKKGGTAGLRAVESAKKGLRKSIESLRENTYKSTVPPLEIRREIFRRVHTVTGNSRTYGLGFLSKAAHELETLLSALQMNPQSWDQNLAVAILEDSLSVISEYQLVQEQYVFNHREQNKGKERQVIKACESIFTHADRDKNFDKNKGFDLLHKEFLRLSFASLEEILSGIISSLDSIAETLGKPVPKIEIEKSDIVFNEEIAILLEDVFLHCIRNSLDHGIEDTETRIRMGKSPEGLINIRIENMGTGVIIRYADDGAGLNLNALKAKGSSAHTDEEIGELIFQSGLSTKEKVNEISGRGIGMDAVRSFLADANSSIKIEFTSPKTPGGHRSFAFLISLGSRQFRIF